MLARWPVASAAAPGAEPPPELKPADVAPKGDLKLKPYTDPRYWSAFILVGTPD